MTSSQIEAVPDHLKAVYKTSFQLSPYAFIEVAARAQKWIDQAISRNMYLETRDVDEMMDALLGGVGAGRQDDVLPAHEAAPHSRAVDGEGQQVRAHQRDDGDGEAPLARSPRSGPSRIRRLTGRKSAAVSAEARTERGSACPWPSVDSVDDPQDIDIVDGEACPVDPMERLQCESCQ